MTLNNHTKLKKNQLVPFFTTKRILRNVVNEPRSKECTVYLGEQWLDFGNYMRKTFQ